MGNRRRETYWTLGGEDCKTDEVESFFAGRAELVLVQSIVPCDWTASVELEHKWHSPDVAKRCFPGVTLRSHFSDAIAAKSRIS